MIGMLIVQNLVTVAVLAVILFPSAGTWRWPGAWIFLAEFLVLSLAVSAWMVRHAPGLLAERMSNPFKKPMRGWDKAYVIAIFSGFAGWMVLIGLDRRFGWSHPPVWLPIAGVVAIAAFYGISVATYRANKFATTSVRIQEERGHQVATGGPYRFVRHPLYAGAMGLILGVPLVLGSWWGLAGGVVLMLVVAARAVAEERFLMTELPGYAEYAARVRHRLIPGVW